MKPLDLRVNPTPATPAKPRKKRAPKKKPVTEKVNSTPASMNIEVSTEKLKFGIVKCFTHSDMNDMSKEVSDLMKLMIWSDCLPDAVSGNYTDQNCFNQSKHANLHRSQIDSHNYLDDSDIEVLSDNCDGQARNETDIDKATRSDDYTSQDLHLQEMYPSHRLWTNHPHLNVMYPSHKQWTNHPRLQELYPSH